MRIAVASDHAEVQDFGTDSEAPVDYPVATPFEGGRHLARIRKLDEA